MPGLKWGDIKLALDARGLTLRQIDGEWRLVDKDTGSAPSGLPTKLKDLSFVPRKKPKGSPGRGYPEGYNLQEVTAMSDVDYRLQQTDIKLICQRTRAIDMTLTSTKQASGAIDLVVRQFLMVHPEYDVWRKYGFWNIKAGIQLILRTSACEAQRMQKAPIGVVKPRKKRGKPRVDETSTPIATGQPALADQPALEDEPAAMAQMAPGAPQDEEPNVEAFNLDDVQSDKELEPEPESEPALEPAPDPTPEPALEPIPEPEHEPDSEQEIGDITTTVDTTMIDSSQIIGLTQSIKTSVDENNDDDGDDDDDDGEFDMSQVTGPLITSKPTQLPAPGASACLSAPPSAVLVTSSRALTPMPTNRSSAPPTTASATSNRTHVSTAKPTRTPAPITGALVHRPPSVPSSAPPSALSNATAPGSARAEIASTAPTQQARSSARPAASCAPVSRKPAAKTTSPPAASDTTPAPVSIPGPTRKSTMPSIVWHGMTITDQQMARIRSNAARQAAGDKIRASPIYKDLIDKLANDPAYDPASEPLPPADPPAPAPGQTAVASAPTAKKARAKPKPKPVPVPELEPELQAIADDATDSNLGLLDAEGGEVNMGEGLDHTSVQGGTGGKAGKGAVGGKGKAVAKGEHAPATARKGKAAAKGDCVEASMGTAAKKAQSKKPATTLVEAPAAQPGRSSTRAKK
ncbi:hypothetical protein FRC10_011534 [Ceratobasidium sp. 414]|nr:hypothetical protein FRC10_011534 [Ceratobasidium sp. 414]